MPPYSLLLRNSIQPEAYLPKKEIGTIFDGTSVGPDKEFSHRQDSEFIHPNRKYREGSRNRTSES